MDPWITPDEACAVLDVGKSQLAGLARGGWLTRSFDRPDAPGRPRYERDSVTRLVGYRTAVTDPVLWMTRREVCSLLEITPRAWVDLRRDYGIGDNGSPVTRWHRYKRSDVLALARLRTPGVTTRYLTESQAAEQLGTTTALLQRRAIRNPTRFGYNHRTRRYSAAKVAALAPS